MQARLKKFPLLILLLCMLFGVSACREPITMDSEFSSSVDNQYFTFDPTTILDDVAKSTENYTPIERPSIDYNKGVDNVLWSSAEYYKVMRNLFENTWHDASQDIN